MTKAEIKRVLKLCRQIQDQLNKTRFAAKGEGGTADLTEINNTLTDLTSRIEQLEGYYAEVIGIEQLSSGLSVGKWHTIDNEGKNLNGDSSEVTEGEYIGIEQLTSGEGFGSWKQVASEQSSSSSSEDVTALQTAVADLSIALESALLRIEQLEEKHAEVVGVEQLKSGLAFGKWQSIDAEGNNLNGDAEDYDEVIIENIETVGIEQLSSGNSFGEWQRVA